jgi:hypothetical protein
MDFLATINSDCFNYNSTNGFGCRYCLNNGREWRDHCMKNKEGEFSCFLAYADRVQQTIPDRVSSNSHTFIYHQMSLKKRCK